MLHIHPIIDFSSIWMCRRHLHLLKNVIHDMLLSLTSTAVKRPMEMIADPGPCETKHQNTKSVCRRFRRIQEPRFRGSPEHC